MKFFPIERKLGWRTMLLVWPSLTKRSYATWLYRGSIPAGAQIALAHYCSEHHIKWQPSDFEVALIESREKRPRLRRKCYLPKRIPGTNKLVLGSPPAKPPR